MATSVLAGLAKDKTIERGGGGRRWPDGQRNLGEPYVLFDDDFSSGFCGWRDHMGDGSGVGQTPPISLTTIRTWNGSPYALMLSTSGRGTTSGATSSTASTYKNCSRDVDSGFVTLEAWLAFGSCDVGNAAFSYDLRMDIQAWDNSHRGFPRFVCQRFKGSNFNQRANSWSIYDDDNVAHHINSDGTDNGSNPSAIGGTPHPLNVPGDNQNKMNWQHVSFTYDLDTVYSTDGQPGGYYQCTIGDQVYDLTGFGAGRHKTNPQVSNDVYVFGSTAQPEQLGGQGDFRGGLNFGFSLTDTPHVSSGPSWLVVGRTRGTWLPASEVV